MEKLCRRRRRWLRCWKWPQFADKAAIGLKFSSVTLLIGHKKEFSMSKQEEAGLILKLYELRREETMRKARDWFFREFHPQTFADYNAVMFGEHSGHVRMVVTYWDMAAAMVNRGV